MNIIFFKMLLSQLPSLVSFLQEFKNPVNGEEAKDEKLGKRNSLTTLLVVGFVFCLISFTISLMNEVDKLKKEEGAYKLKLQDQNQRIVLLTGEKLRLESDYKTIETRRNHYRELADERAKSASAIARELGVMSANNNKLREELSKARENFKCPDYSVSPKTLALLEEIESGKY